MDLSPEEQRRTVISSRIIDVPVVDHLSGPKYHGAVTFDAVDNRTRVTMYWTFENVAVFDKIRDTVIAGNEGNFDRLSEVVAGQR